MLLVQNLKLEQTWLKTLKKVKVINSDGKTVNPSLSFNYVIHIYPTRQARQKKKEIYSYSLWLYSHYTSSAKHNNNVQWWMFFLFISFKEMDTADFRQKIFFQEKWFPGFLPQSINMPLGQQEMQNCPINAQLLIAQCVDLVT